MKLITSPRIILLTLSLQCIIVSAQRLNAPFKVDTSYLTFFLSDGKSGMIDYTGKIKVSPVYHGLDHFSEGLICALPDKNSMLILDTTGREVGHISEMQVKNYHLPHQLKVMWALHFEQGKLLWLNRFYDKFGAELPRPQHDYLVSYFADGLAVVADSAANDPEGNKLKYNFINTDYQIAFPSFFDEARCFKEGRAPVRKGSLWGYIDNTGKLVVPFSYRDVDWYSEGVAYVETADSGFLIDRNGKRLISVNEASRENSFKRFHQGLCPVKLDDKVGFMDKRGEIVIKPEYDYTRPFNQSGLASVVKDNKWGIIDRQGKLVMDYYYDGPVDFNPAGLAQTQLGVCTVIINTKGEILRDWEEKN